MVTVVDRLYVHTYVKTPDLLYGNGSERFGFIAAANQTLGRNVEVWPIFSYEGTEWAAGNEYFMGDWLLTHSPDEAVTRFFGDWETPPLAASLSPGGVQYYEYFYLERHMP